MGTERTEPRRVFLEPGCVIDHGGSDRLWCEDDVWGHCDECGSLSPEYVRADIVTSLVAALGEAERQIEYLHEKFGETGTGNTVLTRIRAALAKAEGRTDR